MHKIYILNSRDYYIYNYINGYIIKNAYIYYFVFFYIILIYKEKKIEYERL